MKHRLRRSQFGLAIIVLLIIVGHPEISRAQSFEIGPYMGAPVELVKAPNGAITNKKLLDRVGDFAWLKPTIENPTKGIS